MATLVATPGAHNANSYITVAEADAYFEGRMNARPWVEAGEPAKVQALLQATRRLDAEQYTGSPVKYLEGTTVAGEGQALKWPRLRVVTDGGAYYSSTVIPQPVKDATCELALSYLSATGDPNADTGLEAFEVLEIGPLRIEPRHAGAATSAGDLPDAVRRLLAPFLITPRGQIRLSRG